MSSAPDARVSELDPFDLPDWLGDRRGHLDLPRPALRAGHLVAGALQPARIPRPTPSPATCSPSTGLPGAGRRRAPTAPAPTRPGSPARCHLVARDGRLTLAVPGTGFGADLVLDALGRLARAVGADPERYRACLRLGGAPRRTP